MNARAFMQRKTTLAFIVLVALTAALILTH